MILRTVNFSKAINADNKNLLLDFLGIRKEMSGIQKVIKNIELIACVPFCMTTEKEAANGVSWTLSTFDLDRYDERIDPHGWDFKRYMKNPVVEWSHRYDIPAIGKIENLTIDDKGLHGVVFFNNKEFDPFGWSIGERVKAGVIRAGSVGFRVLEIEIPDRKTSEDGTSLIFRKQELLEFSICNVPANPFALAKTINNEKSVINNEIINNVSPFWGSFINNLQGE